MSADMRGPVYRFLQGSTEISRAAWLMEDMGVVGNRLGEKDDEESEDRFWPTWLGKW